MKEILLTLDNLVLNVESVNEEDFSKFCLLLSRCEAKGELVEIYEKIGIGYSEYHYNLNIGKGAGAIRVGYKHNSCKAQKSYTMRVEFNPAKQNENMYVGFWEVFKVLFKSSVKTIKQLDLAFDIAVNPFQLVSTSLTGRQRTILKDTTYYGTRGNNGRLEIYNKKKEVEDKQKIDLGECELTRIEYTWKFDKAITAQMFSKKVLNFSEQYKIALLDLEGMTGEVKSMVLAYHHGMVQWKEFTRTSKSKIKKALDNMVLLDIDQVYSKAGDRITEITGFFK